MHYKIGLDIGTTSVGWATVELDTNDEPMRIMDLGVRIFDAAENSDGSSLAAPRREARGVRRRLRRHSHRLERIKYLLEKSGCMTMEEIAAIYHQPKENLKDIYAIRAEALDRALSKEEWARLLIHLAQRRGFKSNRKVEGEDSKSDAGKLTTAVKANQELMTKNNYRTVGEMIYNDEAFFQIKTNKQGDAIKVITVRNKQGDYAHTFGRGELVEEVKTIFTCQRKWGNPFANEALEEAYLKIYEGQRSFEEGPGEKSPYAGNQIERMIGKCTFEKTEERAAKASYTFEYFKLLQDINHLRIVTIEAKNTQYKRKRTTRPLSDDERKIIIALAKEKENLNYKILREKLALSDEECFEKLDYGSKKKKQADSETEGAKAEKPLIEHYKEIEKAEKFVQFKCYHQIRKALDKVKKDRIKDYTEDMLNAVAYGLTVYKNDDSLRTYFEQKHLPKEDFDALLTLPSFSKFGHLSVKACKAINHYLEQGMDYDEACKAAGYDFKGHTQGQKYRYLPKDLPELEDITNPVVRRAVNQTINVINAIIKKYGASPAFVAIELAREMSKNFAERKKIEDEMKDNQKKNEKIKEKIKEEYGRSAPTGLDIVKLKLWEEQGCRCPYCQQSLEIEHLFDDGYAQIDHIVPYSISFDDSYQNKVLVHTAENQQKGNRLPVAYLKAVDREREFIEFVQSNKNFKKRKKDNLLKETLTQEDETALKDRSLNDTRYITRLMSNLINDYLLFAPHYSEKKKVVTAVNGSVTAYMRKRWGITKIREEGDTHHAVDAVVVACVTDGMIQKVTRYSKQREGRYVKKENIPLEQEGLSFGGAPMSVNDNDANQETTALSKHFPKPWPYFRWELEARLSENPTEILKTLDIYTYDDIDAVKPVFVSRRVRRKTTGAAHQATIRSWRTVTNEKGQEIKAAVSKTALSNLKLDKNGEIENYYNPNSDRLLYNALKERLTAFDGDSKKAFPDNKFYKPKKDGSQGPEVRAVKTYEKMTSSVPVNQGVAKNDSMIRVDVFYVENEGYYLVPIYVADTLKAELPDKAIVANKPYEQWKVMKEEDFLFSLYPNDLIKVTAKAPIKLSVVFEESSLQKEITDNECFLYYHKTGISTGSITVTNHDNTYTVKSLGVKTLLKLEKYYVDVLGNYHKAPPEKRQRFNQKERQ